MVSASKTSKTIVNSGKTIFIILGLTIPFNLGKVKTEPADHFGLT